MENKPLTPRQIVDRLDQYIVGQQDAKKAVAVALRNRYRRSLLDEKLRDEIVPKNILMMGYRGGENRDRQTDRQAYRCAIYKN